MIYWNSFSDFIAMGGYGFYVWGSFGVTALVMTIEPIVAVRNHKSLMSRLKRQIHAESRAGARPENRAESPAEIPTEPHTDLPAAHRNAAE